MSDRNHPRRPAQRMTRDYGWPLDAAGNYLNVPGWTNPAQEAAKADSYNAELVRRFHAGMPLSVTDRRDARQLLKGVI